MIATTIVALLFVLLLMHKLSDARPSADCTTGPPTCTATLFVQVIVLVLLLVLPPGPSQAASVLRSTTTILWWIG